MFNADSAERRQVRGTRAVEIRIPALLENLAVVRTLIGALATFEDLDLDAVADLRLAVDEACTRLIRSAAPAATLVVVVDPRVNDLVVEASTTSAATTAEEILTPGSFGWHVLAALADDVQIFHDGVELGSPDPVVGISLTARRVSPSR